MEFGKRNEYTGDKKIMNERKKRKTIAAIGKEKTRQLVLFQCWLKKKLKKTELTQRQLANDLGICETIVSRWIKGERPPHLIHVLGLASYFGCSTDEILGVK